MHVPLRGSANTVDSDSGGAVRPLVLEREGKDQGIAFVRFGHDEGVFSQDGNERLGQLSGQLAGRTIWRVEENHVESPASPLQPAEGVTRYELGARVVDRVEVRTE